MVTKCKIFLVRGKGCPLQHPKIIYIWTFLRNGAVQPSKIIYIFIKTKIGPEIKHFQVAKCKIFIDNAGMQPTKNPLFRFKKGPEIKCFVHCKNKC